MTTDALKTANNINEEIETLNEEIKRLSSIEHNTRNKKPFSQRLCLKKLFRKPTKKALDNLWSSQDLDSVHSIILFDADEIKALVDFKKNKVEILEKQLKLL